MSRVLKEKNQLTFLLRDICSIQISYSVSIGVRLEFNHKSIAAKKRIYINIVLMRIKFKMTTSNVLIPEFEL